MYPEARKSELCSETEFMEGQSYSQTQGRKAGGRKEEIPLFPPTVVPVGRTHLCAKPSRELG